MKLCTHLGLTEAEALAILSAPVVTSEEVHDVTKVDLHAIANAVSPTTVHALSTDPKIELQADDADKLDPRATRVRTAASACDKLQKVHDALEGSVRVDASVLQTMINVVVPQIRARARANSAVKTTYSSLLAYQKARYPGRKGGSQAHAMASVTNGKKPAHDDEEKTST
jgi:hypothetical protein